MMVLKIDWYYGTLNADGKHESGNEEEDNDDVHDQILMISLLKDCSSLKASPPNDGYLASFILPFKPLQDQNRCHYH